MPTINPPLVGWRNVASSSFPFLAVLYVALFGAYGTETPLFPFFLSVRGQTPAAISLLLAAGIIVRLSTGPLVGLAADAFGTRLVLAASAFGAGTLILVYLVAAGFWPLLIITALHALTTSPLNPLADALTLNASAGERAFAYGWVRGIGSAAFIAGTLVSGALVERFGIESIILSGSVLFLAMLLPLPKIPAQRTASRVVASHGIGTLLAIPQFRRMLVVAGLVISSHALSDAFAVIHWRAAGLNAPTASAVWSIAVASEILVFFFLGPTLLQRLGPQRSALVAATGGVFRWGVFAQTNDLAWLCVAQLMHGLTFALMHLVAMRVIATSVPKTLSATAQTLYGTLSLGLATAALTALTGLAYNALGVKAFWLMAAICLLAIPLVPGLRSADEDRG